MSERNIKFWANVSTRYDTAIDIILGENLRPKILGKLNKEENMGKLIEFGCGSGYFTRTLADKSESLISTDISEEMLKIAKERLKGIEFQTMDCENCKFNDGTFDTAFMGLVLLFTDNPQKALKESHRILKPEGSLIKADPDISYLSSFGKLKFLFRTLANYRRIPPTSHFFT
ncbi:MAG: class I SAM-dependent methyltransferase [Methanobacterium sp.]|nr:class I SAM-dependent methyltransferase [Methanobacterium sp.]